MRDRLKELIRQKSCFYVNCDGDCFNCTDKYSVLEDDVERLADHLLANGVIVPSVKVGQTVYQTDGVRIYESCITHIEIYSFVTVFYTDGVAFDETAIGHSIFLTKEEAEKALERSGE